MWSVLLVLGVFREWQESSGGWRSLRSDVLATRLSAGNSPVLSMLLASCGDVIIKQTPGPWVTVLALGIKGLPESAYLKLSWLGLALSMESCWKIKLIWL